ncbi:NAD-dependent epimerase/dehydratase family protein [Pseudoroseicyclus sp. CXY001]|uniref:NAD-dependent epimerase/dehydratase family protein n=1 Tax=Pseudoroseicyclus sp. CXY001 TaxID=3242492 RepID=UPI003570F6AD
MTAPGSGPCVVTGSTGFLGGHLLPALEARGVEVLPLSHRDPALAEPGACADWLRAAGAESIVHLAASSSPAAGDARGFYEANAFLTERLLEGAAEARLPGRIVLLSATSVYGPSGAEAQTEETPRRPLNHYGASKLLAEVIGEWYRDRLDIVVARPSNCIGAGQDARFLVPKLVAAYAARDAVLEMGDTEIARDFIDVRDAADILARLLTAPGPLPGAVNVSSGRATPIREILGTLEELTGHSPEIRRQERFIRKGDMRFQRCDASRALALGHVPAHDLKDTLGWMLEAAGRATMEHQT